MTELRMALKLYLALLTPIPQSSDRRRGQRWGCYSYGLNPSGELHRVFVRGRLAILAPRKSLPGGGGTAAARRRGDVFACDRTLLVGQFAVGSVVCRLDDHRLGLSSLISVQR